MKSYSFILTVLLLMCFINLTSAEELLTSYNDSNTALSYNTNGAGIGESIRLSEAANVSAASFNITSSGTSYSFYCIIYNATGTHGSTAKPSSTDEWTYLGRSQKRTGTSISSGSLNRFNFSPAVHLEANTTYAIGLIMTDRLTGSSASVRLDDTSPTYGGNCWYRNTDGSAWTASSSRDVFFYLYSNYMEPEAPEEPELIFDPVILYQNANNESCNLRIQLNNISAVTNNLTIWWSNTSSGYNYTIGYDSNLTEIETQTASSNFEQLNYTINADILTEGIIFRIWETAPPAPITIDSFTPTDTTPTAINGSTTQFTANLSSSGFWEALVNGSVATNGTGTSAAYNYTTSSIGDKNITIRTDDDQQTWLLTVEELTAGIHEGYWQKWTGTGWDFVNSTPTNNSASLDSQLQVTVS